MKRWSRLLMGALIALSIAALSLAMRAVLSGRDEPQVRARLVVPVKERMGFAQAEGPRPFAFPADHGPHLAYQ
jgi:hypothetical protein